MPAFASADGFYADSPAQSGARGEHWWSGDWYVTLGAKGFVAPRYEGAKDYRQRAAPVISVGHPGSSLKFSSLNDNASSIGSLTRAYSPQASPASSLPVATPATPMN